MSSLYYSFKKAGVPVILWGLDGWSRPTLISPKPPVFYLDNGTLIRGGLASVQPWFDQIFEKYSFEEILSSIESGVAGKRFLLDVIPSPTQAHTGS